MLTERLNELLDKLNATGAEIAKKVDFDRTNISRIKSGKRIPHPDSATADNRIDAYASAEILEESAQKV